MEDKGRSFDNFSTGWFSTCQEASKGRKKGARETNACARDAHEANRHQDTGDGNLVVTKFDALEVLYTQSPRRDEAVEGENLVHLDSGDQCASSLANDVDDWTSPCMSARSK
jgi:hypothetical protein